MAIVITAQLQDSLGDKSLVCKESVCKKWIGAGPRSDQGQRDGVVGGGGEGRDDDGEVFFTLAPWVVLHVDRCLVLVASHLVEPVVVDRGNMSHGALVAAFDSFDNHMMDMVVLDRHMVDMLRVVGHKSHCMAVDGMVGHNNYFGAVVGNRMDHMAPVDTLGFGNNYNYYIAVALMDVVVVVVVVVAVVVAVVVVLGPWICHLEYHQLI